MEIFKNCSNKRMNFTIIVLLIILFLEIWLNVVLKNTLSEVEMQNVQSFVVESDSTRIEEEEEVCPDPILGESDYVPKIQKFSVKGVSFKMVEVQGGTFMMGATSEQGSDAYDNERPTHQVTLSTYYIGQTEVTQALWKAVMGKSFTQAVIESHPRGVGPNYPMYSISWYDCQDFIERLNLLTGKTFRLPTEAEWEYAARGGQKSKGYKYAGSNDLENVSWYDDDPPYSYTHPVATKYPNELGLYDMSGNVWEWCQDWYGDYSSSPQTNPEGPDSGSRRVCRGGSWFNRYYYYRVSSRESGDPAYRGNVLGLRLVLVP